MISIVICSINETLFKAVSVNIEQTIGNTPFEIICIENNIEKLSIFEAYNKGASLAKHPILLFLHEDVIFKSQNWGKVLEDSFKDEKLGLLGLVGTKYKAKIPSGWYTDASVHYGYLFYELGAVKSKLEYQNGEKIEEMVAVDGFFMATTQTIFEKCKFDNQTYNGFHFYDLDFSTQVFQNNYKVAITNQIDIIHKSQGDVNLSYYENMFNYKEKWQVQLPLSVLNNDRDRLNVNLEWKAFIRFTRLVFKFEKNRTEALKRLAQYKPQKNTPLILKYWIVLLLEFVKK